MAKSGQKEASPDTTPARLAETPPPISPLSDYSFTLQMIMEMQKTLAQLSQAVKTLTEDVQKREKTVDGISHKIYAAQVVIWVVGGILTLLVTILGGATVFILDKIWDTILPLVQMKPPPT